MNALFVKQFNCIADCSIIYVQLYAACQWTHGLLTDFCVELLYHLLYFASVAAICVISYIVHHVIVFGIILSKEPDICMYIYTYQKNI